MFHEEQTVYLYRRPSLWRHVSRINRAEKREPSVPAFQFLALMHPTPATAPLPTINDAIAPRTTARALLWILKTSHRTHSA
jgi:isochorismate synthase EntC